MNEDNFNLCEQFVKQNYVRHARDAMHSQQNQWKSILSQRQLPIEGWSDAAIEMVLREIAIMDSNNHLGNVGVGEREGRVFSPLVRQRHFHLSHGIGRSGNLSENQPKAAGSSLVLMLTNHLVMHAMRLTCEIGQRSERMDRGGSTSVHKGPQALRGHVCQVVPMATGMTLALVLLSLKSIEPKTKKYVIWTRIDQKSVLKCIGTANLTPVVIENCKRSSYIDGSGKKDCLTTDTDAIDRKIEELGAKNVLSVLTTTACFAPRLPDDIVNVAKICKKHGIHHIVNNAYGVQCTRIMADIDRASQIGTVTSYVQSTDKNFMVPVGGAIVASNNPEIVDLVRMTYAGRASSSPVVDLFITLTSMGQNGWLALVNKREELMPYFVRTVGSIAEKFGERVLETHPGNPISFGMTLDGLSDPEQLGSMLFYRNVSGPRVVNKTSKKTVAGIDFHGFGSHCNRYPHSYLTMACSIGITRRDIDQFSETLEKCMQKLFLKKN